MRLLFLILISVSMFGACTSSGNLQSGNIERGPDVSEINTSLSLLDHFRKIPGLTVLYQESDVLILMRGINSINGENNVLFVVDGIPIGTRYLHLTGVVDIHDVKDIKLLRGSMGSQFYGMRGANGVVELRTIK